MQTIFFILLTILMGIMLAVYLPMNSTVARYLESPIAASIPFFFIALVTTIFIFFIFSDYKIILKVSAVPFHFFLPGFFAAFIVLGTTFLIPKIGARKFFILTITGQVLMGMVLSNYGFLESPKDPITFIKICGAVLMLAGAVLSTV